MITKIQHLLPLALAFSTAACADSASNTEPGHAEQEVAAKPAESGAPQPDSLKAATPTATGAELAELVKTVEPQRARNGGLRFSDPRLDTPEAAALVLERLRRGGEREDTRKALALQLPRTQGSYAAELVELLKIERSEDLRASYVDAMRLAKDSQAALEGLDLGLADSSATVRARAAFNAGRRADGKALTDSLVGALGDSNGEVQAASARALGQLGAAAAFDKVRPLLSSREADVRLEALRALGRMDAERAASLPELSALAKDDDARIQTAAAKVQARAY